MLRRSTLDKMTVAIESIPPTSAVHRGPMPALRRFRLDVSRLQRGMFVVELDRPWLDTPFLIQGFLIDSDIELQTLQRYCAHVYVDLDRSTPETIATIRASAIAQAGVFEDERIDARSLRAQVDPETDTAPVAPPAEYDEEIIVIEAAGEYSRKAPAAKPAPAARTRRAPATRDYKIRADVQISRETRDRFRSFVRGMPAVVDGDESGESLAQRAIARLRGLLGGGARDSGARPESATAAAQAAVAAELQAVLPPGTRLVRYTDRHDAATERPRARVAFERSDEVLSNLVADIRGGRVPNLEQVGTTVSDMVESLVDNPDALLWVAQMREENRQVYQHGVRVSLYLMTLGRQLGLPLPMINHLGMIGMLADVGKTRLPRALLDKPGMLNPAEYGIVKEHVRLGLEALAQDCVLPTEVELGIAQHHERLDGSGYPKGLKGNEISLFGRMAAIADCFAALSAPRSYANPLAAQDALMSLYQWADTSFHGPLVEHFVQAIGVFPVGSLVELSSGEVAVVVAHNRVRRLEPRVLLLTWPDKRPLPAPLEVDLLHQSRDRDGKSLRVVRGLPSGAYGLRLRDFYADGSVASS